MADTPWQPLQPFQGPARAGDYFHPRDRSSVAMFYRAHDQVFGKLVQLAEIQNGPNPLTEEEWSRMQARWPDRYGHIPYVRPRTPPETA